MEKSTVYFTDFRCPVGTSQLDKLKKLCIAAGIHAIDMDGKFVAIKMHFGELGNLAFLRPNYAKVVADLCKEQGGLPFLTDCNTLYPGSRRSQAPPPSGSRRTPVDTGGNFHKSYSSPIPDFCTNIADSVPNFNPLFTAMKSHVIIK